MSLGLILIIVLVVLLVGGWAGPQWGAPWQPGYGFGNGGIGLLGILLIILVVLALTGRI